MTSIVFTADDAYLPYIPCSFAQLARFGRKAESVVLVAPPTLSKDVRIQIEDAAASHGINLRIKIAFELERLYSGALIDDYWYMSTSKLFLAELLPDLDDMLYIDVDTLIRAPLDELLAWKLRNPLGAVVELTRGGAFLFGTPRQPYFNAGVLRMSLDRMRRERVGERARDILSRHVLPLQDQDVFNLLFADRFDYLPFTFNVFDRVATEHPDLSAFQDPVIVHFTGLTKPWIPGSNSPFAREWRRQYSHLVLRPRPVSGNQLAPTSRAGAKFLKEYAQSRHAGRSRAFSLLRTVLPEGVRRNTKAAAVEVLDLAQDRIERIRSAVLPDLKPAYDPTWGIRFQRSTGRTANGSSEHQLDNGAVDRRLDLLISLPNSGTHALGDAIRRSRPDVRYLPDLYRGVATELDVGERQRRFPWFTPTDPEALKRMSPAQRLEAQRYFTEAVRAHVVEFTEAVVQSGPGRCLINVLPDQLHPSAFCELLEVFRPRLLFLRRPLIFSYLSQAEGGPGTIEDRRASHYALRCDSWIDGVAEVASSIGLESVWLTCDGLFETGDDVALLESFYPGSAMPVDAVPDRRSDGSILAMVNALGGLSATTQARLLRLPGRQVGSAADSLV